MTVYLRICCLNDFCFPSAVASDALESSLLIDFPRTNIELDDENYRNCEKRQALSDLLKGKSTCILEYVGLMLKAIAMEWPECGFFSFYLLVNRAFSK